jgi:hypothetical protein
VHGADGRLSRKLAEFQIVCSKSPTHSARPDRYRYVGKYLQMSFGSCFFGAFAWFLASNGQTAPYYQLLRPESPCRLGQRRQRQHNVATSTGLVTQ